MADKSTIIRDAQKYLAKGQIDKAISEWEKLLQESPDGNTYNIIGDLYLKKGDRKGAVDTFHRAARFFRTEGFSLKALALYKKVLNIQQNDADALYALGELSEEKGIVTDAIKYFLSAADSLSKEGKKDRILSIYEKILSLSPANVPLRIKVAEIFLKEGLRTDASREYLTIGKLYEEKEEFAKAQDFFRKAIETQPLSKAGHIALSRLLEKTGDLDRAYGMAKEAAVLFPDDIDVLFRCTEIALVANHPDGAQSFLRSIREKDPENARARRLLGEILTQEGDAAAAWAEYQPILDDVLTNMSYDEAIRFLEPFKDLDPVETSRRLVSLYRQLGEMPSVAAELTALGTALREQGEDEEALTCFREAFEIAPDDPYLRQILAPEESAEPELSASAEPGEPGEPEDWETEILKQHEQPEPSVGPEESPASIPEDMFSALEEEPLHPDVEEMQPDEGPSMESLDLRQADEPSGAAPEAKAIEPPVPPVEKPPRPAAEHITIRAAKPAEEILTEADIFSRYGLVQEARKLLDSLKEREPENLDLHIRLKGLCGDMNDAEGYVTECLILHDLYSNAGDRLNADQMLQDAFETNPADERLAGKDLAGVIAPATMTGPPESADSLEEDYDEQIAEADFYTRQGLIQEAVKILERLHRLFPDNQEVAERLQSLGGLSPEAVIEEAPSATFSFEAPEGLSVTRFDEAESPADLPASGDLLEEPQWQETPPQDLVGEEDVSAPAPEEEAMLEPTSPSPAAGETEFEDVTFTEADLVEAEEMPEPALDNDVLEIFQEFKKGLEKELENEDSETHYNLGIAYKEMGLVDDAITEFQTAKNDPKRFIQSSTMLGVCYIEKGLFSLAIDVLTKAMSEMKESDESFWAIKYDLADAYERNNDLPKALEFYTGVYGWNAKFRNVADRLSAVRGKIARRTEPPGPQETAKPAERTKERKDRVSYL